MCPLTLYFLVRGTMITIDETLMGAILGISTTGPQIFGKNFATLNWNSSEALSLLFGYELIKLLVLKVHFLSNV